MKNNTTTDYNSISNSTLSNIPTVSNSQKVTLSQQPSNYENMNRVQRRAEQNRVDPETHRKKKNNPKVSSDPLGNVLSYVSGFFPGANAMPIKNNNEIGELQKRIEHYFLKINIDFGEEKLQENPRDSIIKNLIKLAKTSNEDYLLVDQCMKTVFLAFPSYDNIPKEQGVEPNNKNYFINILNDKPINIKDANRGGGKSWVGIVGSHDVNSLRNVLHNIVEDAALIKKLQTKEFVVATDQGHGNGKGIDLSHYAIDIFLKLAQSSIKNRRMVNTCVNHIQEITFSSQNNKGRVLYGYNRDDHPIIMMSERTTVKDLKEMCRKIVDKTAEVEFKWLPDNSGSNVGERVNTHGKFTSTENQRRGGIRNNGYNPAL